MRRLRSKRTETLCAGVAVFAALALFPQAASAACLNGGTSDTIIAALNATGVAELCQGSLFVANKPIPVAANQRIFTTGYPVNDAQKAMIQVKGGAEGKFNQPMIQAYAGANVQIRNIKVDGNRAVNGKTDFQALIAISGNNSVLDRVTATNTAGLSAIAASDNPNCSGLQITNNLIKDNGLHTGGGSPFANGIDFRCNFAYVAYNEIRNATDGSISYYGGRYTVIEHNWIANDTRSAYSAIIAANLYAGDFTGSVVRNNLIETCCGQHFHVALAIGTHLWCDDAHPLGDCQTSSGVSFLNNTGSGTFGFGIVVDGMLNATVQGNNLNMTQWTSQSCYVPNQNWYVVHPTHSSGSFQAGYASRTAIHWSCLSGGGH